MSNETYVNYLENQVPVKVAIANQLREAAAAAPNAEKEEDAKEQKPSGANETDVAEDNPKGQGEAAPNAAKADDAKKLTTPPEKEEPGNDVARWDGKGKLPATFSDPLLKNIVAKMDGKAPNLSQNDPLRQEQEEANDEEKEDKEVVNEDAENKSPLESLEEESDKDIEDILGEDEKVIIEEDDDEIDPRESAALNRLIAEMDQISSELEEAEEDELLDDDDLPISEDLDEESDDDIPDDVSDVVDELV